MLMYKHTEQISKEVSHLQRFATLYNNVYQAWLALNVGSITLPEITEIAYHPNTVENKVRTLMVEGKSLSSSGLGISMAKFKEIIEIPDLTPVINACNELYKIARNYERIGESIPTDHLTISGGNVVVLQASLDAIDANYTYNTANATEEQLFTLLSEMSQRIQIMRGTFKIKSFHDLESFFVYESDGTVRARPKRIVELAKGF